MNREAVYVVALVLIGLLISRWLWFLPALLILPGIISFTTNNSVWYLSLLAVAAELVSVLPFGVTAVVIFIPWLVKYLSRRADADVSFSYLLLVLLMVVGQMFALFLPDVWDGLPETLTMVPWLGVVLTVVLSSLFIFGASVLIYFNKTW